MVPNQVRSPKGCGTNSPTLGKIPGNPSPQALLETGSMSDERFDGKSIYKFMSASMAVYDIRGRFVHKARSASMPEYEIRGDHIYKARRAIAESW
jgi:hypothetical protein